MAEIVAGHSAEPSTQPTTGPTTGHTTAPTTGPAARPRVLGVCIGPARRHIVVQMLGEVVAAGGSALLLIADGAAPDDLPPGVEVLDLVADERRVGVHTLLRPHRVWQLWGTSRPYRAVRPWVLWRALRRRLDVVRLDELDHIVIVSVESWPITWQLCRRSSSVTYGWDVPAALFARTPTPQ
ncbi:MAG: hypothetical protein IPJ14_01475 [Kineosporiaceae bacterium]|nr:hypothetical protein [Kineosporiaceae bacterium]